MARKRIKPTPALFYGYPVELIQLWCGVSRQTAYLYKIGARKPSKAALRLFVLHRDGRVLGPGWDGWTIRQDRLLDPDDNETTQNQLRAYWIVVQLARELARDAGRLDEYYQLLKRA
jgi:hypothetical protein